MTTFHYHLELDDEESMFLKKLLREYLKTADPDDNIQTERNIKHAKSILVKRCENMEQMSELF